MNKRVLKRFMPSFVIRAYERQLHKERHINRALRLFNHDTAYVEIGVRDGACVRQIRATCKYAIDPAPVGREAIEADGTRLFEMTSGAFFEEVADELFRDRAVHVALVDGLHEFRQALQDVLNLERFMHPEGILFIHDCNPPTRRHAEDPNGPWNGDVWKVAYYLTHHRQDLHFMTLDCDWGLGVLSGFHPTPPALETEIIDKIASLDYNVLDASRNQILNLRSPLNAPLFFARRHLAASLQTSRGFG